jgi:hypothetical protein
LPSYWLNRKPAVFQDQLVILINHRRDGHCFGQKGRGETQVKKSPRLSWATHFSKVHTIVHVPLMLLSEWPEFPSSHYLARNRLLIGCVSILLKSLSLPDMHSFSLCIKKRLAIQHMNRPHFQLYC